MRFHLIRHNCFFCLSILSLTGCVSLQDSHYEHSQKLRTELAYLKFWWHSDEAPGADYASGWKAGYLDVTTGNDGTPPLFAPHRYWSPWQTKVKCDRKRQDWYTGFQDGAMLASLQPDTHYLKVWAPPTALPPGYYEADPGNVTLEPSSAPAVDDAGLLPNLEEGKSNLLESPSKENQFVPKGSSLPPPPEQPMPVP